MTVNNKIIQNTVQINSNSSRTLWIDIAKGLLILSMVVGHSTDLFNQYIYQFHMGAFFILSGYVTDFQKRSILQTVANKFLTLILPLLTMILIFSLFNFLFVKLGIYDNLYKNGTPLLTIGKILKKFFTKGEIWVWWLGACWFLVQLFLTSVFSKFFYEICSRSNNCLFFLALLFLIIAYQFEKTAASIHLTRMFALSFFLYILGYYLRVCRYTKFISNSSILPIFFLVISSVLVYVFANRSYFIDMANGKFNSWYLDILIVFNGFLLTFCVSNLLKNRMVVSNVFSYLGKNTVPIIFFHFAFFKVAFLLLCFFGVVDISYLNNFVPTTEIGRNYWWLISFVAIFLSLSVWKLLLVSKYIAFFCGRNRNFISYIENKVSSIDSFFSKFLSNTVLRNRVYSICLQLLNNKTFVITIIIFLTLLVFVPLVSKGIILNDELQIWQLRENLVYFNFKGEIDQGRILLRAFAPINTGISFIFSSLTSNIILQLFILFFLLSLVAIFIKEISGNNFIAIFLGIVLISSLPVTFEHAVPNAFIGLVCIPLIELFISLILFIRYLDKRTPFLAVSSFIFLIVSTFGYEYMVLTLPLFFYVYGLKYGPFCILNKLFKEKFLVSVLVLLLTWIAIYVIQPFIFNQAYSGSVAGFVSFKSSFKIIKTLYLSSLPGYYLFNNKYEFLRTIYDVGVPHYRSFCILLLTIILSVLAVYKSYFSKMEIPFHKVCLSIVFFMFFPVLLSIPNGISKMYQGQVSSSFFTSLPVSTLMFISHCIWITLVLYYFLVRFNNLLIKLFILGLLNTVIILTQYSNEVVLSRHYENFERLSTLRLFYETDLFKNLKSSVIYSLDAFRTNDLLAVHDNYFDSLANNNRLLRTVNSESTSFNDFKLFQINDSNVWCLSRRDDFVILSNKLPSMPFSFVMKKNHESIPIEIFSSNPINDHNIYISGFTIENGKVVQKNPFSIFHPVIDIYQLPSTIHMNSNESGNIEGLFEIEPFGRWASDELIIPFSFDQAFRNFSSNTEFIYFSFMFVNNNLSDQTKNYTISAYLNQSIIQTFAIRDMLNEHRIIITVPVNKLKDVNSLKIRISNVMSPAELGRGGDLRKLSLALSSIVISDSL